MNRPLAKPHRVDTLSSSGGEGQGEEAVSPTVWRFTEREGRGEGPVASKVAMVKPLMKHYISTSQSDSSFVIRLPRRSQTKADHSYFSP